MLRAAYREYLEAGATPEAAPSLADALAIRSRPTDADLLRAYARYGAHEIASAIDSKGESVRVLHARGPSGDHARERVFVGPRPPPNARIGALWFDVVDLTTSELVPYVRDPEGASRSEMIASARETSWFALRPVARYQFAAFLDIAPIERARATALAPARILAGPELEPVTSLMCDEAMLYLSWVDKSFATELTWEVAAVYFATPPWSTPNREWTGSSGKTSGMVEITSPELLPLQRDDDHDPELEDRWMFSDSEIKDDVTFRSCVDPHQRMRSAAPLGSWTGPSGARIAARYPRPA
jgi:hypothetical protein